MKESIYILVFLVVQTIGYSQINIGGKAYSMQNPSWQSGIPSVTTAALNMSTINATDIADENANQPPRFGFPNSVSYNLTNSGTWKTLPSGEKLWQLKINCPSSKSINFVFSQYHLPPYAMLHIYNPVTGKSIGSFTNRNNKGTLASPKKLTTGLVYGDNVILELKLPANQQSNTKLQIGKIVHGYRYIYYDQNQIKSFGSSGPCNVNINCPEGNNAQNQKRGVAMMLIDGYRFCTGSLVNNTANDKKLYLLTAHHCLLGRDAISNPDISDWAFAWDYEAPSCTNPNNEPPRRITTGGVVRANNPASDFALLELSEDPVNLMPPVLNFFNGWDRSTNLIAGGYGIHHPKGDVKKISTFSNVPNPVTTTISGQTASCWNVDWVQTTTNYGITEPASSGSPLFSNNGRVIGQLFGGPSNCDIFISGKNDQYGRFSTSWNNSTDNRRRLMTWLDPLNTNSQFIDGIAGNPCYLTLVNNQTLNNPPLIQDCTIYSTNSTVNTGNTTFQVSKEAVLFDKFEVKNGAEFEIKIW
jgi:lysyl endopeptidase